MIAKYPTRGNAEIYASELAQLYGPAVHFHVVEMSDLLFGDTVWYVLGTGMVHGHMFGEYAQGPEAATAMHKPILPAASIKGRLTKDISQKGSTGAAERVIGEARLDAMQRTLPGLTSVEVRPGKQRLAITDTPLAAN